MQGIEEGFPCTLGVYYVQQAIQNAHLHCLDLAVFLATDVVSNFSKSLTAHSFVSFLTEGFLSHRAVATTILSLSQTTSL